MATNHELDELRESIDGTRESLDEILRQLERLDRSKAGKFSTFVLGLLVVCMFLLGLYVWDNARDSRDILEENLETSLQSLCEESQESRIRLRGVFELLLSQAAAQSSDPEQAQQFVDQFNDVLMDAVPDRDCAAEARERNS